MGSFSAVVLAAGQGKRTGLPYPKVIHPLCGKPMILWVLEALTALNPDTLVTVIGPEHKAALADLIGNRSLLAIQEKPLGTGHALQSAFSKLQKRKGPVLVACADTPLLTQEIFYELLTAHSGKKGAATLLTAKVTDSKGYGRIVRNNRGGVVKIVEEKDASSSVKKINEINAGTYVFEMEEVKNAFPGLTKNNAQQEYYLTDCISRLVKSKRKIFSVLMDDPSAALGVNTLKELAFAAGALNKRIKEEWLGSGVIFSDPDTVYLDADVHIGPGTCILPFSFLEKGTRIGSGCKIGPFSRVCGSQVGDDVVIQNSIVIDSIVQNNCSIGPFAYLRPGTKLEAGVKIGDFVEIKNSTLGQHSKVSHLSYVGDAVIGKNVNIGAGAITCNYDGKGKYSTIIEEGAFIGSNTNLVAPVRIGKKAVTGAGSVVTKDVEANTVVVGVPARKLEKGRKSNGG